MSKDRHELNTLWNALVDSNAAVFQTADGTEAARAITEEWLLVRYSTDSTEMPHGFRLMPTQIFTARPHYHDSLVLAARLDLDSDLCDDIHGA
jgi:hypothetical protein